MNVTRDRGEDYKYDVCLSFAGEEREYVEQVAAQLRSTGIRVFYDSYERVELWGKDLYAHLDDVYRRAAHFCVLFISQAYASKLWTNHERRSAQARAFGENKEYILPARFDDTEVPGLPPTIGYVDLATTSPGTLAEMIVQKLGPRQRINFLPPDLDELYAHLGAADEDDKATVDGQAHAFLEALRRMSEEERLVVMTVLVHGCPTELPENTHVAIDLVRRHTGFPVGRIKRILGGLRSLGIYCQVREGPEEDDSHLGTSPQIVLEFHVMTDADYAGVATHVAYEMVHTVAKSYCDEHLMQVLLQGDFSQLSSATYQEHKH
jgi:hypothetical protein